MTRLVRMQTPRGPRTGIVVEQTVHACVDPFAEELQVGEPLMPLAEAHLLPPVRPSKIVCVGRNYAAHAAEHGADVPSEPMLFLKPPSALIGPGAAIELPPSSAHVEHEVELAVVIGKRARDVAKEEALDYVLGYTCANDVSARDFQRKDGQWGRAKGFDTFCPLGPWVVTGLNPADLALRAWVNEELRQASRTSNMVFDVPTLVAFISGIMTLEAGDVILTGTPEGVGPLHAGDTVRVEVEGVGVLSNPVIARA